MTRNGPTGTSKYQTRSQRSHPGRDGDLDKLDHPVPPQHPATRDRPVSLDPPVARDDPVALDGPVALDHPVRADHPAGLLLRTAGRHGRVSACTSSAWTSLG